MTVNLSEYELSQIKRLPLDVIMWASKYPVEVFNVAEALDDEPFPQGYIPIMFEVYFDRKDSPSIFVNNGVLEDFRLDEIKEKHSSILVMVDSRWVYIEVEKKPILDKLNGIVLPNVSSSISKVSI